MSIDSLEIYFSIRNLSSLKIFHLLVPRIDENNTIGLFDQMQNIEELHLNGNLFYFNLDSLVNLKKLSLCGRFRDDFNLELLKNLAIQLEYLNINISKIKYESILKLLNGHNFSNLLSLDIRHCNTRKIEKKFMDQFPSLQTLRMIKCNIETIEDKVFSNLKELTLLDLSENWLTRLYKRDFSDLINLEIFYIGGNPILFIEDRTFSNVTVKRF